MTMVLHGYYRSSASWRVRIALALKQVPVEQHPHHLRRGEQRAADYLALNPQGLVPTLELGDGRVLTQSLAIIEYLDALYPDPPLLPSDEYDRARVRAFALAIACDIHPVQNLKILQRLRTLEAGEEQIQQWIVDTITEGFDACTQLLPPSPGPFCFGDRPGLADLCLVPQLANARRFNVPMRWPRLDAIDEHCRNHPAFAAADAAVQPDAE